MIRKISPKQLLDLSVRYETATANNNQLPTLALDFGEKFCGLAVAPDGVTVLPAAVVATGSLNTTLQSLMETYKIKTLVVGLPLSANGAENHLCVRIRKLALDFENIFATLKVVLVNERFSTKEVLCPDKARVDDLAAMRILEYYLSQTKR